MHWNIRNDTDSGYVHAYQSGPFSAEEQAAFLSAIFGSPFWQPGTPLIIDYCSLDMDNVGSGSVEVTRQQLAALNGQLGLGKLALLCDNDEKFGVGRQFQALVEDDLDREVRVFRDEDAAVDWVTRSVDAEQTNNSSFGP
jgi:hypothetical protein